MHHPKVTKDLAKFMERAYDQNQQFIEQRHRIAQCLEHEQTYEAINVQRHVQDSQQGLESHGGFCSDVY